MLARLRSVKEAIECFEKEADITTAAVQRAIGQQSQAMLRAPASHPSVHPYTSSYAQAFYASYANNDANQYDQGWNELGEEYPQPFNIQPTVYAVSERGEISGLRFDPPFQASQSPGGPASLPICGCTGSDCDVNAAVVDTQ